jgi:dihydroorotate dehydrogenase electron transfer subunit
MKNNARKEYRKTAVKQVTHLNPSYFVLETETVEIIPAAGQFYLIKPVTGFSSLLHIPLSIYDVVEFRLRFFCKTIGKGTQELAALRSGDEIFLLGPLGTGFTLPENCKTLLVSGGIGYAPLFMLKKQLIARNNQVLWLHGGQSTQDIFPADIIYTDDGSSGEKGFVTEGMRRILNNPACPDFTEIYSCGPKKMMKTVSSFADEKRIPLQVSLEEYMACGLGTCLGCVVKMRNNEEEFYGRVCKDGPVFQAKEVIWNE